MTSFNEWHSYSESFYVGWSDSDLSLSDIDFKNKKAWVWTTLKTWDWNQMPFQYGCGIEWFHPTLLKFWCRKYEKNVAHFIIIACSDSLQGSIFSRLWPGWYSWPVSSHLQTEIGIGCSKLQKPEISVPTYAKKTWLSVFLNARPTITTASGIASDRKINVTIVSCFVLRL